LDILHVLVVNCFQIVSLIYWAQRCGNASEKVIGCELLSDCIFDILSTTKAGVTLDTTTLWIAFRLYLWYIEHNWHQFLPKCDKVVNCFQIVSLIYWAQQDLYKVVMGASCELLSDCIFDILSTTRGVVNDAYRELWIAFRLYLWYIEHNIPRLNKLIMCSLWQNTEIRKKCSVKVPCIPTWNFFCFQQWFCLSSFQKFSAIFQFCSFRPYGAFKWSFHF